MALAYKRGDFVTKDLIASYAWYHVSEACKTSLDEVQESSLKKYLPNYNPIDDKLKLNLTDTQIKKAESLASELFKQIELKRQNKRN